MEPMKLPAALASVKVLLAIAGGDGGGGRDGAGDAGGCSSQREVRR